MQLECETEEDEMKVGMVGVGRMRSQMLRPLLRAGRECVAFDLHPLASKDPVKAGAMARH